MNNNGNINDGQKIDEPSSSIDAPQTQNIQQKGVPKPVTESTVKSGGDSFSPKNAVVNKNDVDRLQQALNKKNEPLSNNRDNQSENNQAEGSNQQGQEKKEGLIDKGAKTAITKAGGTAITAASGGLIPKPLADMFASKLSGPALKMIKFQIIMFCLPILLLLIVIIPVIIAGAHAGASKSSNSDDNSGTNNTTGQYCTGDPIQAKDLKNLSRSECIKILGPLAQADYASTGILASVTLGQAIMESGCGTSPLAQNANNLFGMMAFSSWTGATYRSSSGSVWRKYDSVNDSIRDHSKLLTEGSNYKSKKVAEKTTYKEQLKALQSGNRNSWYCQDSHCAGNNGMNYVNEIAGVIESSNLTKWDVKSGNNLACGPTSGDWKLRTVAPTKSDSAFDYLKKSNVGQCVWYAQGRAIEILQELMKNDKIDKSTGKEAIKRLGQIRANAEGWYRGAKGKFKRSSKIKDVKAGSIIVWSGGSTMCNPRCGHVAVVESVTDKEVIITDGWANGGSSCPGTWSCVRFRSKTMSLKEFYKWLPNEGGQNKEFTGYIYFLELDN